MLITCPSPRALKCGSTSCMPYRADLTLTRMISSISSPVSCDGGRVIPCPTLLTHDVGPAKGRQRGIDDATHLGTLGHVPRDRVAAALTGARHRVQRIGAAGDEHDPVASPGQDHRQRGTDSRARAGDDYDFLTHRDSLRAAQTTQSAGVSQKTSRSRPMTKWPEYWLPCRPATPPATGRCSDRG